MTKQRQLILSIIQQSEKHLSAEEIYVLAREQMPSIVLATVYNNLNVLTEQNLIRRVNMHGQRAYYDKNVIPHDHIICDCCGEMADIEVGDLLPLLRERSGVDIISYELNLHYICENCKQGSSPA
ncbi:MAG: Fur family transcriptional regulator [Butyricicoccus sp.]